MATLASAMTRLDEADREQVDVVFVTTDPARDTETVLRDYLDRFDPTFVGAHRAARRRSSTSARRSAVAVEQGDAAAQRRVRRHARHAGAGHRRRRRGADRLDAGHQRHPVRRRHPPAAGGLRDAPSVTPDVLVQFIPSPAQGVWHLGPVPIRGYALCIILGIVAAIWIGERRWVARGGRAGEVADVAIWAVPFGVVGGRLYHVHHRPRPLLRRAAATRSRRSTSGAAASASGVRSRSARVGVLHRLPPARASRCCPCSDALAPGVLVAQAIGRWGNWFNQELFGKPTDLPWGLEIDPAHRPPGYEDFATFHPTFLYEFVWYLARLRRDHLGRPQVPARPRPGARALRDGLHRSVAAGSRCCASTPSR